MKKKIQAGQTIWTFLNALSEHVITPTTFEIRQLDNNKQPRRAKSKATLLNQRIIKMQRTILLLKSSRQFSSWIK